MKITKSQLKRIIKEELEAALKEGGAFASDEEIQDITNVASEVDPDIQTWPEFYEAARIAWNEGKLQSKYEPSKHEVREAWKKHPGNSKTHDPRLR
jgi:K+-transporting ATPase c subunit